MSIAAVTVVAESATDVEPQYDTMSLFYAGNRIAYFFDHAHNFMIHNCSLIKALRTSQI
jgi:hypothetical protein